MAADSDSAAKRLQKTYVKEGALIGGGVGAVVGGFMGYELSGLSESSSPDRVGGTLAGALICGLVGVAIGGFTGSFVDKP